MRTVLLLFGILVIGGLAHPFLPWYAIVIVAFLLGLLVQAGSLSSFGAGFAGGFLLWGIYAGYLNHHNAGLLAGKMGQLMGGLSPLLMVLLTAFLGGLLAGMGALSGNLGRAVVH